MATYTLPINSLYTETGDDVFGKPLDGNFSGTDWTDDNESAIEKGDTNVYEIVLDETKGYVIYLNGHSQTFTADSSTDVITAAAHGLLDGETVRFKGVVYAAKSISVGSGDLAGNIINCTAHGFTTGMRVRFYGSSLPAPLAAGTDYYVFTAPSADTFTFIGIDITATGSGSVQRLSLPAPLMMSTVYFVRDKTTNTFKVAATGVGAAINLTDNGSGTMTLTSPAKRSKAADTKIGTVPQVKDATLTGEGEDAIADKTVAAIIAHPDLGTGVNGAVTRVSPTGIRAAVGLESANLASLVQAVIGKKTVTDNGNGTYDIAIRNTTDTTTLVTIRHNPVTGATTVV
jgi:hypothetical protein